MNLDPGDCQIHILLINIDSLSFSLSLSLSLSQGRGLTDWRSSFSNMGVWTDKQHLATSDLIEGWISIGQEVHVIRGSGKVKSTQRKNQTSC